jgi:hypothetical protein
MARLAGSRPAAGPATTRHGRSGLVSVLRPVEWALVSPFRPVSYPLEGGVKRSKTARDDGEILTGSACGRTGAGGGPSDALAARRRCRRFGRIVQSIRCRRRHRAAGQFHAQLGATTRVATAAADKSRGMNFGGVRREIHRCNFRQGPRMRRKKARHHYSAARLAGLSSDLGADRQHLRIVD